MACTKNSTPIKSSSFTLKVLTVLMALLISFSSSIALSNDASVGKETWRRETFNRSAAPVFTVPVTADPAIISPKNHDNINDRVDLAFRPSQDGFYNLTIEEDIRTVDSRANTNALAGTASRLLMLGTLNTLQEFKVFARFSTDLGQSWTPPVATNLTDYCSATHAGFYYANLDLVYNTTDGSYILGAIQNTSFYTFTLSFFKSFDGINWTFLNQTLSFSSLYFSNFDMAITRNMSEIVALVSCFDDYWSTKHLYFVRLRDDGKSLEHAELVNPSSSTYYFNPAISVSPVPGCITIAWSEGDYFGYTYRLSNSVDGGKTWSTPVTLDTSRGFVKDDSPLYSGHNCRSMQLLHDQYGKLHVTVVINVTRIYTAWSGDDGLHWSNMSAFRAYFGMQAFVYSMHVVYLKDDVKAIAFIGSLDGNLLANTFTDYGTSYFLLVKTVYSVQNVAVSAASGAVISWDGTQSGEHVRDGPYLVRAWIKNAANEANSVASEARFVVDNIAPGLAFTLSNPCFSPASNASVGIKDATDIAIRSSKNAEYHVFCTSTFEAQPETQVTAADAGDLRGDVAMDKRSRIWCAFTGYSGHNRDIYLCSSDDYGLTFSVPVPLVVSSYPKDCASIAIYGNSIYIVYFEVKPRPMAPLTGYSDLYLVKSTDLGVSWSTPLQITSADAYSAEFMVTPDILVMPNGTLVIVYNQFKSYSMNRIVAITSQDGGTSFSAPAVIRDLGSSTLLMTTVSIGYDPTRMELVAMTENYTISDSGSVAHMNLLIYNSSTAGSTWSFRNMVPCVVDETAYSGSWAASRGVTIDILSNGTWRSSAIGQTTEIRVASIQSNDGGFSWHAIENGTIESALMTNYEYPDCHTDLRSGTSPFGDVLYAYTRAPNANPTRNVYLKMVTSTRQHFAGSLVANVNKTVTWNGKDLRGVYCSEGNYTISIITTDKAGNRGTRSVQCVIDNTPPEIVPALPDIKAMQPGTAQLVGVRNLDIIDYTVMLHYRYSETGPFTALPATYNGSAFVQTIPPSTSNMVLFYFVATDQAGNSATLGPWFYFRPTPVVVVTSSEGRADRPLDGKIKIEVQGLPRSQLQSVLFSYQFDNMSGPALVQLEYDNNTANYVGFLSGSQQRVSLKFQVFIIRLGFNESEPAGVLTTITQERIPMFPDFTIAYPWNLMIAIASALFGLTLGLIQARAKRTTKRKIQARFMNMIATRTGTVIEAGTLPDRPVPAGDSMRNQLVRSRLMYGVMTLGTLVIIAGGGFATFILHSGGIGMLLSALGLLLSALALMERVNIDASDAIYLERKRTSFFAFIHVILIISVLAVFMMSAPLVEWFNYYVIKQSYTFGPIVIPRLYISLVTPVITSIALIWISSYSELKNALNRIKKMQGGKADFKVIWRQKEEIVSKLASNVSFKVFIFLVTIALAVITTTQLIHYAEQGIILLVPFIITWLVVFLINSFTLPGKDMIKDALDKWIIERSKSCSKCGATNLLNSVYCTACGEEFSGKTTIVEKTVECKKCMEQSPEGSKYCRGCGVSI